jgi:hypothetical protein
VLACGITQLKAERIAHGMRKLFSSSRRWLVLLLGLFFLAGGNYYQAQKAGQGLLLPTVVFDLGMGLFVAAVVSLVFDLWYQQTVIGTPLNQLHARVETLAGSVERLGATVVDFNQVLKAAQANGIHAIYRRNTSDEVAAWKQRVRSTIVEARNYILIMGRSLDDLLPYGHVERGVYREIADQATRGVPVVFLFADTFSLESDFRRETLVRTQTEANAYTLYLRNRESIKQLLDLAREFDGKASISIRLLIHGPPFALFMNETTAIIEPYLPYLVGGEGIVYEVRPTSAAPGASAYMSTSLHHSHRLCFTKLHTEARNVADGLAELVARREKQGKSTSLHRDYHKIAETLELEEPSVLSLAQLF